MMFNLNEVYLGDINEIVFYYDTDLTMKKQESTKIYFYKVLPLEDPHRSAYHFSLLLARLLAIMGYSLASYGTA